MTRDETVALWQKCEGARAEAIKQGKSEIDAHEAARTLWNTWAEEVIEKRKALEKTGQFRLEKFDYRPAIWIAPETCGGNDVTSAWLENARVDFHGFVFEEKAHFDAFIFPGQSIFGESKKFTKDKFYRPSVAFRQGVEFGGSRFLLDAVFDWCHFDRSAGFSDVNFCDVARFDQCLFLGTAWFHRTHFMHEVWMGQVKFKGYTDFYNAQFDKDASFYGVESEGSFILTSAKFRKAPDFTQAKFQGAPRIDNAIWPEIGFLPWLTKFEAQNLQARYRAIRQLATQGQDHEYETKAFKNEVRAKRGAIDRWYHPGFWSGLLYDGLSDFGRSLLRPFLGWSLCIVIFAIYFLGQSPDVAEARHQLRHDGFVRSVVAYSFTAWKAATGELVTSCVTKTLPSGDQEKDNQNGFTGLVNPVQRWTNPVNEALSIAYHNAVLVLDSSGESSHRAFGCLYGVERYGGTPMAYVPRNVALASGIQKLLSAIFLFLFGLALRNNLRMR